MLLQGLFDPRPPGGFVLCHPVGRDVFDLGALGIDSKNGRVFVGVCQRHSRQHPERCRPFCFEPDPDDLTLIVSWG